MGDEFETASSTAASSFPDMAAALGVSPEHASNSAYPVYPKYTPEQLVEKLVKSVKSSDLDDDGLRTLVGEIITSVTNQLYEIIKERES